MARVTIEYRVTVDVPTEIAHNEAEQHRFEFAFNAAARGNLASGSYTDYLPTGIVETLWATFHTRGEAEICSYHFDQLSRGRLNPSTW